MSTNSLTKEYKNVSSIGTSVTEFHTTGWLMHNRNLFLRDFEAGKSTIKVSADSLSANRFGVW